MCKAYKSPMAKTADNPHFFFVAIWRFHIEDSGRSRMEKSEKTFHAPVIIKLIWLLMQ